MLADVGWMVGWIEIKQKNQNQITTQDWKKPKSSDLRGKKAIYTEMLDRI